MAASIIVGVGEYGLIIKSKPRLGSSLIAPECTKTLEISFCNPFSPVTYGLYIESSYTEEVNTFEQELNFVGTRIGTIILF